MTRLVAVLLLVAIGPARAGHAVHSTQLVTRDAFLMGTRAQLAVYAPTRAEGMATLERALRILEATEDELSTWRDDSAISALNRQPIGVPWQAPAPTCRSLRDAFMWTRNTGGAFDPTLGRPSAFALDEHRCAVTRTAHATIDVGAFGKGDALDRVEAALGAGPWMINLGGQVSVGGARPGGEPWSIAVAHPVLRDRPFRDVPLREGSLSTSGNAERGDHIIDPATGRPATFSGSVTVWHRSGLAADALSTALYVMGPEKGIAWAGERGIAALYLIPDVASDLDATAASGLDASVASGFDASVASGFDASVASGFDVSVASGFDVSVASGFDASVASGFDASVASGFDASVASGFSRKIIVRPTAAWRSAYGD